MTLRLDWKPRARRDLDRLDSSTRSRIVAAMARLAETDQGDVVKLAGKSPPEYRLRVGGWRVRFAWDQASGVLCLEKPPDLVEKSGGRSNSSPTQ